MHSMYTISNLSRLFYCPEDDCMIHVYSIVGIAGVHVDNFMKVGLICLSALFVIVFN